MLGSQSKNCDVFLKNRVSLYNYFRQLHNAGPIHTPFFILVSIVLKEDF